MPLLARRYDDATLVRIDFDRDTIGQVTPVDDDARPAGPLPFVAPGLIDLQVNGYAGQDFASADSTPEKVVGIARRMDAFGVRWFLPTLCTASFEVFVHALRTIDEACQTSREASDRIAGVHVEGPYISPEDGPRGAHARPHCRNPDWDEFQRWQEAAGGRIRIVTLAPELPGAFEFIRRTADSGVVVGLGHTAADAAQIRAAVDAGARLSTHLGNGAHAMIHRHRNYLWSQLAEDRLRASLICDGHHLPPEVVKTFVRAKTPERCILISDVATEAGLPPGRYETSACGAIEVLPSGRLVVAGQVELMAGAAAPLGTGVANVTQFAGVELREAIAMALDHPAELLGLDPGALVPGQPADLVLFDLDEGFRVRAMIRGGETVFGRV